MANASDRVPCDLPTTADPLYPNRLWRTIPEPATSDRWKLIKDPAKSKNKKGIDLSGDPMMNIIRRHQINSRSALLKHMADCYKGERGSNLQKSHLTTEGGEFLYYCDSIETVPENGVQEYQYRTLRDWYL